jgi:hypothetical protein
MAVNNGKDEEILEIGKIIMVNKAYGLMEELERKRNNETNRF